ncbi:MAG: UvrD-helicase domain-containing protein [Proteobacteria bacterium]|nr:UvrD-helicase domain-containing protein [Pseudomonadota bacterium]
MLNRSEQLLAGLNEAQRKAATILEGPAVVFAGAGSGKTRIITTRVAWLIEQGVRPWEILAVTFTNKAAAEMRERLRHMSHDAERSLVTTFHSACARWLREFAPELGFTSDFSIYDDSDSNSVIKKIMKTANYPLDKETTAAELRIGINEAKTLGLFPSDAVKERTLFNKFMPTGGIEVYRAYQESLAMSNAMDFGDLIMNMLLLLRTNERVRRAMQSRFKYVLVDEYQDTNRPQMELIEQISALHGNIFIVGDDDQSIYSWRGAVPSNILDFNKIYPSAQICKLEENYRCTANIVNAAAAVVSNNTVRAEKTLKTSNPAGEKIEFRYETDGEFEAYWVAKQIQDEVKTFDYDDVAIFYRTNSQSRVLEDALRRDNIPYRIYGSVRFYDRAEVKDILAYLKILVNPRDDVSFMRALNIPARGLGDSAEEAIQKYSRDHDVGHYEAAKVLATQGIPRLSNKLRDFVTLLEGLNTDLVTLKLNEVIEELADRIGYFPYILKKFPDQAEDKEENVMELASAIAQYAEEFPDAKVGDWLQSVTLSTDVDGSGDVRGVTMMTLHMAKGLEFDRVYLTGLEDGLLPHFNSIDELTTLEEERRLLYVGMTRAKKKLSLTAAHMRRTWGQISANDVSRFLGEIPEKYVKNLTPQKPIETFVDRHVKGHRTTRLDKDDEPYYEFNDESVSNSEVLEIGATVSHPTYGTGTIEEIQTNWGKPKIVVRFADFGLRRVDAHHLNH